MTGPRAERIAQIVQKRRPLVERLARAEGRLDELAAAVRGLEGRRDALLRRVAGDADVTSRLASLDFAHVERAIADARGSVAKLRARFSRETLNIGVVGRARQGKSRLLQSLTGLSAMEIPDGDRQHCTGVRSTVFNQPGVAPTGKVWFHTEASFLNHVIAPYYDELGLPAMPSTVRDFGDRALPSLPIDRPAYADRNAKHERLRLYHGNLNRYAPLFAERSPRAIPREDIRAYVAQDTPDGQRVYFNWCAVDEVEIFCEFPAKDVGPVALVDMPGLGDTGVGDEKRLIQALGEDVDVVLFVRMPKSTGDAWMDFDVQLYDSACKALTELPLESWSFMVLNRTREGSGKGDNGRQCEDLAATLGEKHLKVAALVVADCSNPEEVRREVLDRVIDYMAANVQRLDERFARGTQEKLDALASAVDAALDQARRALGDAARDGGEFPLFLSLFNELWNGLTNELEQLVRQLRRDRDAPDENFAREVKRALESCRSDTRVPDLDEIERRRNEEASFEIAYNKYLHEVRAHLSHYFLRLDEGLKESLERVKSEVVGALSRGARLATLSQAAGGQWLRDVAGQVPESLARLRLGFETLGNFDLSYRGLVQHRVRKQLDILTPDEKGIALGTGAGNRAKEIQNALRQLHAEALYRCEGALQSLATEPSEAAFAIVEEFVDRVVRAKGVKDEWQQWLWELRSELWPSEFQKLGERSRLRREWDEAIRRVADAGRRELLRFTS